MIWRLLILSIYFISSIYGLKLHEHMTKEEIQSVFNCEHDAVHKLEYEVVKILHTEGNSTIQNDLDITSPTIQLKAFAQDYNLYLENNNHVLFGSKTVVYTARQDPYATNFNLDSNIIYTKAQSPFNNIQTYHDVANDAAVTLHRDADNRVHVDGVIGDDIVIRSLPRRVHEEVLTKNDDLYSSNNYYGSSYNQQTAHVVIRSNTQANIQQALNQIQNIMNNQQSSLNLPTMQPLNFNSGQNTYNQYFNWNSPTFSPIGSHNGYNSYNFPTLPSFNYNSGQNTYRQTISYNSATQQPYNYNNGQNSYIQPVTNNPIIKIHQRPYNYNHGQNSNTQTVSYNSGAQLPYNYNNGQNSYIQPVTNNPSINIHQRPYSYNHGQNSNTQTVTNNPSINIHQRPYNYNHGQNSNTQTVSYNPATQPPYNYNNGQNSYIQPVTNNPSINIHQRPYNYNHGQNSNRQTQAPYNYNNGQYTTQAPYKGQNTYGQTVPYNRPAQVPSNGPASNGQNSYGQPSATSPPATNADTVYPELLVVMDYETYTVHGNNIQTAAKYIASFWNAVDLRYRELSDPKVRLNIAAIVLPEEANGASYMERNLESGGIASAGTLNEIGIYFNSQNKISHNTYDIVVALTSRTLYDMDNSGKQIKINGMARTKGACRGSNSVAIVYDKGSFNGVATGAHELGHSMGAPHDFVQSRDSGGPCPNGNLMSYSRTDVRGVHWSQCSVRALKKFLKSSSATCLQNKPDVGTPYSKILPGKILSRDEQCRRSMGMVSAKSREDNCAVLWCQEVTNGYTIRLRSESKPPAEGSTCTGGGICLDGECVIEP